MEELKGGDFALTLVPTSVFSQLKYSDGVEEFSHAFE
jgi:hypothetical protein